MRCLRPPTHLLQLLPQSSLPKVPVARPCPVVGGSPIRTPGHALLPRRLHRAARDRRHRPSQQGTGLRHPVPRRRRNLAHDRRRSQAPRRRDRLLRRPPHLGADAAPSSAPPLRRHRRRSLWRRQPLDRLPVHLLSARPRAGSPPPPPRSSPPPVGPPPRKNSP